MTVTVDNAETTAPTVSLTAPASGTVSGTVTLSATASDNVGVAGVQFLLDGTTPLGTEDTTLALQRVVEHHHGRPTAPTR